MGMFDAIKSIGKAAKNTAMTPVDLICDIGTGGGDLSRGGDSYLERRAKKIGRNVKDAYEETFDDS